MSRIGAIAASLCCSVLLAAKAQAGDLDEPLLDYRGDLRDPSPVVSEPAPARLRHFDDAPFQLGLALGFGTTVGLLGVVGEYNPLDRLAVGAGLGLNPFGPVWGVHTRFRPLVGLSRSGTLHALFVAAAYSRGRYNDSLRDLSLGNCHDCYSVLVVPENISWAQFELGWEAQFYSRFTLRTSLGVATALNRPDWRCEHDGPVSCAGETLPSPVIFVQTLALGWAF